MSTVASPLPPPSPSTPRVRRRPSQRRPRAGSQAAHLPHLHHNALVAIRAFLKTKTCYDVFPVSFRVTVLDTKLEVRKALTCLVNNGIVSAPLMNGDTYQFAGMLTVSDFVHLMAYHYANTPNYDDAATNVEKLRLEDLREVERKLGVPPPPMAYMIPSDTLWDASQTLITSHARRLPLLDTDTATDHQVIVSVLTQYRLLKFISINCKETESLHLPLRQLGIGTFVNAPVSEGLSESRFEPIKTARLDTPVYDVVNMFSQESISAVPILDKDGVVVNLYETVDVISLVKSGSYYNLDMTVDAALAQRSTDFPGVIICSERDSLSTLMSLLRTRRVHRLVVVENEMDEKKGGRKGRLRGIITLADVLQHLVGGPMLGEAAPMTPNRGEGLLSPEIPSAPPLPGAS